ncbi:MAG: four helix bundle protein [Planctomycetes bacterium]|nr:four helix bundle protein [Planctomycetota bacterium]
MAYTQRGSPESPGGRDIPGRNEPAGLRSAEDLVVWQKADKLARRIYLLTSTFPHEEVLGMAARLREVALTLAPYIAEAYSRPSRKESRWLLNTAFGSLRQLRYLLGFSLRLGHLTPEDHQTLDDLAEDVYKLLWILYRSRR